MKRIMLSVIAAVGLAAASGAASAQDDELGPVVVRGIALDDCTPPNYSDVCSAWHDAIRRNFSEREIGMLFGAATAYPEYRTSYSWIKERYVQLQDEFAANYVPVATVIDDDD